MNRHLSFSIVSCFVAGLMTTVVFANGQTSRQAQLDQLERQVSALQHEVAQLRTQMKHSDSDQSKADAYIAAHPNARIHYGASHAGANNSVASQKADNYHSTYEPVVHQSTQPSPNNPDQYKVFGTSVVTGPFTEKKSEHTGRSLLVNSPSINEDGKLLYRRQLEQKRLKEQGLPLPKHPRLVLSGKVVGKALYNRPYHGAKSSDIDLSSAELDAMAEVAPKVNGFMAINYDNGPSETSNRRISNSNIKLDKAFLMIGDLSKSPFYGSVGQLYVPFGRYSSSMISDTLTNYIGKTKARTIILSYAPQNKIAPYVHVFAFKGDAKYGNSNIISQNGIDAGLRFGKGDFTGNVGASYIANIADSNGMQDTGRSSGFKGFDKSNVENITHRVGGADVHASFGYGSLTFLGEYLTALQQFNQNALSFNSHGAKPSAFHLEGIYAFHLFKYPTSFGLSYDRSYQALGLNIPEQRMMATLAVTVLRNTVASLEFRHDINYSKSDTAMSNGLQAYTPNELGKTNDTVTAELGVYF